MRAAQPSDGEWEVALREVRKRRSLLLARLSVEGPEGIRIQVDLLPNMPFELTYQSHYNELGDWILLAATVAGIGGDVLSTRFYVNPRTEERQHRLGFNECEWAIPQATSTNIADAFERLFSLYKEFVSQRRGLRVKPRGRKR